MKKLYILYEELKRRNVIKAVISYLVISWVLLQVVALIGGILNAPLWLGQTLLISLLVFFPIWIVISWYYEITPEGIRKTKNVVREKSLSKKTGQQLNKITIFFLLIAVVILVVDRFSMSDRIKEEIIATYKPPQQDQAIAVLPFSDFSQDNDQAYFANGLSEELLNLLSKIKQLKVTSRTSSFSFKNSDLSIVDIAKKLGVNYILEGSVRKNKDQLRITAQLIDAVNDKHIWSKNFDHTDNDIFTIQNEVGKAVVEALQLEILEDSLKSRRTSNEAYELYLQANELYNNNKDVQFNNTEILLNRAIALDSTYIPAQFLLAKLYQTKSNSGYMAFDIGNERALEIVEKILKKEPDNALAIALKADISLSYQWDFSKAEALIDRALKLAPSNAQVLDYAGILETSLGNTEKAIVLYEYATKLDPINSHVYYGLGIAYNSANRLEDAEKALRESIKIDDNNWASHFYLSTVLRRANKLEESLVALETEKDPGWRAASLAAIYYKMNKPKVSNTYLNILIDEYKNEMPYQIATVYAIREEPNLAFKWLDYAYKVHDVGLNEILSEPDFGYLHKDPRWKAFIDKLGFFK
ncbi:MAG: tetratricopeptide repeat protein [Patiriisocius sp.]|uniref:tetratricopeptide repeat protein n=1 Tax=Patiriisocius sp. TaxID=2822396 RepID=UPI003EF3A350